MRNRETDFFGFVFQEASMKRMLVLGAGVMAALLIFAGCASTSVAGLASSSDSVGSIKKLAKMLTKDSSNQEAADVFEEIYNREMTNNLAVIENGTDKILSDFAASQGKSTAKDALAVIVSKLGDRSGDKSPTVMENMDVKKVESRMTELKAAYYDLMEIQKAVKNMPEEIGSESVYTVDKSGEDFEKGWTRTSDALADFYVLCGDSMLPSKGYRDLKNIIEIYEKKAYPAYMSYDKSSKCKKTVSKLYIQEGDDFLVQAKMSKSNYSAATDDIEKTASSASGALEAEAAIIDYRTARSWDSGADISAKLADAEELSKFFDENR